MAPLPSPSSLARLQALQKDFQQIAAMAGYLNSAVDFPQLRLFFTLYGRILVANEEAGHAATPRLQAWADRVSTQLREDSSSAVLPPQASVAQPQPLPNGEGYFVVATLTFGTKVTENSYQRVRAAVLSAYQSAVALRDKGQYGD